MKKAFGVLVLIGSLWVSGAWAQNATANHTVTVKIPQLLRLTLDTEDVLFDFTDTAAAGDQADGLFRAGVENYVDFLESGASSWWFAPTSYSHTTAGNSNDWVTADIVTNQSSWNLSISYLGVLPGDLTGRLLLGVDGASYSPATVTPSGSSLASGDQGHTAVELRYALDMHETDTFDTGVSKTIAVVYKVAAQ